MNLNETHEPALASWVKSANERTTDFPIQNLPFAVFRRANTSEAFRGGVAIGEYIVDLQAALHANIFAGEIRAIAALAARPVLNDFMAAGAQACSKLRLALSRALRKGSPAQASVEPCLIENRDIEYALPALIGDYTDFYTSIHHAQAVGKMLRPDNPLLPNYKWVPIGYHGRSSSIAVSGHQFARPLGQTCKAGSSTPVLRATARLDYELELGVFIGRGNLPGLPIDVADADAHVFGQCLLNDWSARDIQAWEYQPLGPFLAKNFATTISPWIVTLEALAPYRVAWTRPSTDPQPLAYLDAPSVRSAGAIDITLEAYIETETMRQARTPPHRLARSNFKHAYWTVAQMVAHHTVNGCNLRPGDLLGTGTQSGPSPGEAGSLLELTMGGKEPIVLTNGETRRFLEDGDAVILRGFCERAGMARIGFGEVRGRVLPGRATVRPITGSETGAGLWPQGPEAQGV